MMKELNLQAMKENALYLYSNFVDHIENCSIVKGINVYDEVALDGNLYTVIQNELIKSRINSMYAPATEAIIWAEQYEAKTYGRSKRVFLMFGLGNGYFVRELLKVMGEEESIVIYEPNKEVFLHIIEKYDISDLLSNPNLFLAVEEINQQDVENILRQYELDIMRGQSVLIPHPGYESLFQTELKKFMSIYNDIYISAVMNSNTASTYGERWAEAEINNLPTILESNMIEECRGIIPKEVPVILVASGPSLSKNAKVIKKAKGKALILAVDSAVKYMHHFGVEPDFIVSVDVIKLLSHFQNPVAMNTPMILSVMSNPQVVTLNKERKIFFDDNRLIKEIKGIDEQNAQIIGAGSVATSTFVLATYLGAKKIILVGQDLAFQGNASHALGDRLQENYSTEYVDLIEGNDGTMIKTRFDWYKYLCWYNDVIPKFDGVVINATEGGAKIKGTKIMPLDEAINEYCTVPYDNVQFFKDLDQRLIEKNIDQDVNTEETLKKGLEFIRDQLVDAQRYLDEAIIICDKVIADNNKSREESYAMKNNIKRLIEINSRISKMAINELLEKYTYNTTMKEYKTLFVHYKSAQRNREHVYNKTKSVYESMRRATTTLLQKVEHMQ